MKKYLVACKLGCTVESYFIEVPEDYIPASDDMLKIKDIIVDNYAPRWQSRYAAPCSCGGYISTVDGDYIKAKDLDIIAISNLQL